MARVNSFKQVRILRVLFHYTIKIIALFIISIILYNYFLIRLSNRQHPDEIIVKFRFFPVNSIISLEHESAR